MAMGFRDDVPRETQQLIESYELASANSSVKELIDTHGPTQHESTCLDECVYRGKLQLGRFQSASDSVILKCALCLQAHHVVLLP